MQTPQSQQKVLQKARNIRLVIFDVDGVLTDGRLLFDGAGREYKSFHARDGHGIKMLRETGVEVAIISGRRSASVAVRMKELGIQHVYQGTKVKTAALKNLCHKLELTPDQVAFVGDDLPDLPIMRHVGLAIAVHDAHFAIKPYADWCTTHLGGQGAAREVSDFIMRAQSTLDAAIGRYLADPE